MPSKLTFTDLITKPDQEEQAMARYFLQELSRSLEEENELSRTTVFEGFLEGLISLAIRRDDERYFQKLNETRRMLLIAKQRINHAFESLPTYSEQKAYEKKFGSNDLNSRDSLDYRPGQRTEN